MQYYEQFCFRAQDYLDYIALNNGSDITTSIQSSGLCADAFNVLILCFETTFGAEKQITIRSNICYSVLLCMKLFDFKYFNVILNEAVKNKAQNK